MQTAATYTLKGITDDVTSCDCCGRVNLRCTVALEREDGEIVHFGRDCAGKALLGRKSAKNTSLVERRARAIQKFYEVRAERGDSKACDHMTAITGYQFFMRKGQPFIQLETHVAL